MFKLFRFSKKKEQETDPVIDSRINPKWRVRDSIMSDGTNCPIIIREFYDAKTGKQLRRREKWQRFYANEWCQALIECEVFANNPEANGAGTAVKCSPFKDVDEFPLPQKLDPIVVDAPVDPNWVIRISDVDDSLKDVYYSDPVTGKILRFEQWKRFREYGTWYEQLGQVFLYEYKDGKDRMVKNRNFEEWEKLNEWEEPDDDADDMD